MLLNRSSLLAYSGIPPSWGISRFPDPAVALPSAAQDIAWAPDESAIAILTGNTTINAYQWSPSGFGSRLSQQSATSQLPCRIFFSPSGSFFGINGNSQIRIYQWSSTTGLGPSYSYFFANLGIVPAIVFSKTDGHIFTSITNASNGLIALPFTGTSFGTPLVPPTPSSVFDNRTRIAVHPDGGPVVITGINGVQAFEWTGSAWGARSTVESRIGTSVAFHPLGNALALGADFTSSGNINRAYSWSSSGRGSSLRFAGTTLGDASGDMQFSPQGDKVLLHSGGGSTPQLRVLRWGAGGAMELYRNPPELPQFVSARESAFSPSGNYLAVPISSAPFIHVYTVNPL